MKLSRRLTILLAIVGVLLLTAAAIGVYGLITGPQKTPDDPASPTATTAPSDRPGEVVLPLPIRDSDDPVLFARSVARALFTWDTTTVSWPDVISDAVLEIADPTGYETPGLYNDLSSYLPSREQWGQLRDYDTSQRLEITSAQIPAEWEEVAEMSAEELPDGAVAVTVDGTRIRAGVWDGEAVEKPSEVSFTLFLACPEDEDSCHLLRLSALGSALR